MTDAELVETWIDAAEASETDAEKARVTTSLLGNLRAVAERAAQEERDACAMVCEEQISGSDYHFLATHGHWDSMAQAATNCAAAIRARGAKDD